MRIANWLALLLLWSGCATRCRSRCARSWAKITAVESRARRTLFELYPRGKLLTQRAVVTAAGRQFSCDGLLQLAEDGGLRLALLAPMGVLAELRVQADGTIHVVKTARSFPESWARKYVATTAKLLYPTDSSAWKFGFLTDGRPVLWKESADGARWLHVFRADGAQWQESEMAKHGVRCWHAGRDAKARPREPAPFSSLN